MLSQEGAVLMSESVQDQQIDAAVDNALNTIQTLIETMPDVVTEAVAETVNSPKAKEPKAPMKSMVGAAAISYALKHDEAVITDAIITVPLSLIVSSDNPRREPERICNLGYDLVNSEDTSKSLLHMALSDDMEIVKQFVDLIERYESDPDIKENENGKLDKGLFTNIKTITGLATSLAKKQVQAVMVRKVGNSGNFALVYGQRRTCAKLYLYARSRLDIFNKVEGAVAVHPVIIAVESKGTVEQGFDMAVQENFGRKDFTPLQEGRIYHDMLSQVNKATGKRWNLRQIALAFKKPYMHVRSRAVLHQKRNDETGKGLTDADRTELENGTKTLMWAVRRSLGEKHYSESGDRQKKRRKTLPVREIEALFDATPAKMTNRREALAECMYLTLAKATKESEKRLAAK